MRLLSVFIAMLPIFTSCGKEEPLTDSEKAMESIRISNHPRARAAELRVGPGLLRDLAKLDLHLGDPVFIRAFKEEKQLEIFIMRRETGKYELFRTYPIAATSGVLGPKLAEGDGQVPEGFYFVNAKAMNPDSTYHLSFNIGFPNQYDRAHDRTGSNIMIHGNRVSIGCLAMTDEKIEEIFTLCDTALRNGQDFFRVHIFPFKMTAGRLARESANTHADFWENLKTGYDFFEKQKVPPNCVVKGAVYQFRAD